MAESPQFEYRPQQQRMAELVGAALDGNHAFVCEAATGVGKSLAYLVPAVTFALEQKRKAIICTHTINLQEQLITKDIPIGIIPPEDDCARGVLMFVSDYSRVVSGAVLESFHDFAGKPFPLVPIFKGQTALVAQLVEYLLENFQVIRCEYVAAFCEGHDALLPSAGAKA